MFAVNQNGTIYVSESLDDALLMSAGRRLGKNYIVVAGGFRFVVRAESVDQAQRKTITVFRKEGKKIPSGFQIQLGV